MLMRLKLLALAAVVGVSALTAVYQLGKHNQRQQEAVDAAHSDTKALQNRAGINETINNMDGVALCIELGGVRDQCEQLRGMAENYP